MVVRHQGVEIVVQEGRRREVDRVERSKAGRPDRAGRGDKGGIEPDRGDPAQDSLDLLAVDARPPRRRATDLDEPDDAGDVPGFARRNATNASVSASHATSFTSAEASR